MIPSFNNGTDKTYLSEKIISTDYAESKNNNSILSKKIIQRKEG